MRKEQVKIVMYWSAIILLALLFWAEVVTAQEMLNYASSTLTGTVTLSQALVPGKTNQLAMASAYSFSQNGLLQFSPGPQPFGLFDQEQSFVFSTDASGNITAWSLNVSASAAVDNAGYSVDFISSSVGDFFADTTCTSQGCSSDPVVQTAAGSWTVVSINATDPPPTVAQLQAQVASLQSQLAVSQAGEALSIKDTRIALANLAAEVAAVAQLRLEIYRLEAEL